LRGIGFAWNLPQGEVEIQFLQSSKDPVPFCQQIRALTIQSSVEAIFRRCFPGEERAADEKYNYHQESKNQED